MNSQYPQLLSPLKLGNITLSNRVIMGSMHIGLEDEKDGFSKLATFYKERAHGDVGLIITGGISPNFLGKAHPKAAKLTNMNEVNQHKLITTAVHAYDTKIALQILHTGRYAYHPLAVSASNIKSPISPFKPWQLWDFMVKNTISHYIRCAKLAKEAGYDGVEVMGSEGYLINQFIVTKTNKRNDQWGGSYSNRIKFPLEIIKGIRQALGPDFIIIYRLSMLDLVAGGSSFSEVIELAKAVEKAGASIISSGIGWHEARIPTIATLVPRGTFAFVTAKVKEHISIPIVATNRINTPEIAESIIASGQADLVALARPLLADSEFVKKAALGRSDEINTCIACNQACLDHVFENKPASCLVNPRAGRETILNYLPTTTIKNIAVVGAGPAGLSFASIAAQRGHKVTLFEANGEIGGQFNLAKKIPGKSEFTETIRYFKKQLELNNVDVRCGTTITATEILNNNYDEIILSSGITPNTPDILGINHSKVVSYLDVILGKVNIGEKVAIIGAGGIGFDVAEFLLANNDESLDIPTFLKSWGIDASLSNRGGLLPNKENSANTDTTTGKDPSRKIYLMQRKPGKLGKDLGKTTGWIHRIQLKNHHVKMMSGINYQKIDDKGLHYTEHNSEDIKILDVDNIVICAGQHPNNCLHAELTSLLQKKYENITSDDHSNTKPNIHLIGGAKDARRLDAKLAIADGAFLAAKI